MQPLVARPCRSATGAAARGSRGRSSGSRSSRPSVLGQRRDAGPAGRRSRPGRRRTSTSGTRAFTNGTSASRAVGVRDPRAGPGRRRGRARRRSPSGVPVRVVRRQPDQLVVVELVGVLRATRRPGSRRAARCRARPRRACGRAAPRSATSSADWCRRRRRRSARAGTTPSPAAARRAACCRRANRRSGSSVRTSTVTSPRRPCGLPIRPTTTSTWLSDRAVSGVGRHRRSRSARRRCRPGPR